MGAGPRVIVDFNNPKPIKLVDAEDATIRGHKRTHLFLGLNSILMIILAVAILADLHPGSCS